MALALLMAGFRFDIEVATMPRMRAVNPTRNESKIRIPPIPARAGLGGRELTEEKTRRKPRSRAAIVLMPVQSAAVASPSPPCDCA
jgi:hypothetical protein